jgi:hypothetical protein
VGGDRGGGGTHAPQGPLSRHCPFLTGRYKSECRQRAVLVCNLSSVPRVSSFLTSSPVPETQVSLLASGFKLQRKGLGWAPGLADYNLELSVPVSKTQTETGYDFWNWVWNWNRMWDF